MKVGFVFGNGSLPCVLLEKLPNSVCVILDEVPNNIGNAEVYQKFSLTQIPQMLDFFESNSVTHICLAGFVKKPQIGMKMLNFRLAPLLFKILFLPNKGDNALLTTILSYVEEKGFKIISATEILPSLLAKSGVLTDAKPSLNQEKEINLGINFLEDISKYDISQACIVQNHAITALEGIEGTKKMINRMAEFNNNAILVKMPKIGQTLKVDMPTIGIETINDCIKANIVGIAIKAEQTIVLDFDTVIKKANENGIFIISVI